MKPLSFCFEAQTIFQTLYSLGDKVLLVGSLLSPPFLTHFYNFFFSKNGPCLIKNGEQKRKINLKNLVISQLANKLIFPFYCIIQLPSKIFVLFNANVSLKWSIEISATLSLGAIHIWRQMILSHFWPTYLA